MSSTFYVSTSGSPSGDGSFGNPWDLRTLFNYKADNDGTDPPASIHPGDTVYVRGGTYRALSSPSDWGFNTVIAGTPGNPVTFLPYPGEHVIIDMNGIPDYSNGETQTGVVILRGGYVVFRDFEVTNSATDRINGRPGGIAIRQGANGAQVINNIVHDCGDGVDHNDGAADCVVYGNVCFNNGWDDHTTGLHQGGTGHGMYAANNSGFLRVHNNIIATSFGYGFHFYSAGSGHLTNFDIQDNASLCNGYWTRYHDTNFATEGRTTDNFLIGHRPITALQFLRNHGFHREQRYGQNTEIGFTGTENISAIVRGNTLIGGVNSVEKFPTLEYTGNLIASSFGNLFYTAPASVVQQLIDQNTYYYYKNGCGARFTIVQPDGQLVSLSDGQWQFLGFDHNSTLSSCPTRPSGSSVRIVPNVYDFNRAHIFVCNFDRAASVAVDLSSVLSVGDSFEIRNAQDYYGAAVLSGTYTGGSVTLPMSALVVATPVGYNASNMTPLALMTSGPDFGAFVILRVATGAPRLSEGAPGRDAISSSGPRTVTLSEGAPGRDATSFTTPGGPSIPGTFTLAEIAPGRDRISVSSSQMDLLVRASGGRNIVIRPQSRPAFYSEVTVSPAQVEVYWRYEGEPSSAARFIGLYLPGQQVTFPYNPLVDRRILLSTITISAAGVRSVRDLRDAPDFPIIFQRETSAPTVTQVDAATHTLITLAIDDYSSLTVARKIRTADDAGMTTNLVEQIVTTDPSVPLPRLIDLVRDDGGAGARTIWVAVSHSSGGSYSEESTPQDFTWADSGGAGGGTGTTDPFPRHEYTIA